MSQRKTGTRTPQIHSALASRNQSGSKNPKIPIATIQSKRMSPIASFKMLGNGTNSNSSLQKYIKQVKSRTKKLRRSLEKECWLNSKKQSLGRKLMSSTVTPKARAMCQMQRGIIFKGECKNMLENYMFMYQIGFGGFGKVWKVQNRLNFEYYAMKEMEKRKVINKDSVSCILNQLNLLKKLRNPFIVNLHSAFQTENKLYMIMDYLKGADLRYHICYKEKFTEQETKFIMACLIQGISYIHGQGVIHRDIKPQNLVLEESGYVRFTDFGISKTEKQVKEDSKYDSSGTPGYMAPEIMEKKPYTFAADFFALGVIAYELMIGERPYTGKNREQIRRNMKETQVRVKKQQVPPGWGEQALDFINQLLMLDPSHRLGSKTGAKQLKRHKWMNNIDWKRLAKKELKPPFTPNIICETKEYLDEIHCYNEINEDEETEASEDPLTKSQQNQFFNYGFQPKQQSLLSLHNNKQKNKKIAKKML